MINTFTHLDLLSPHEAARLALMQATLEMAVPFKIADLLAQGGPQDYDFDRARRFGGDMLGPCGDQLLYRTKGKPGDEHQPGTAKMMNELIFGLAVLSFCPGGVEFVGLRWNSSGIE